MKKHKWRVHALSFFYPAILIIAIGLTACHKEMSPLTSGILSYQTQSGSAVEKELSVAQLKQLSIWLEKHSNDWNYCFATVPGPRFSLLLKHANGSSSSLWLINLTPPSRTFKAHHLDGSNKSDQPCALLTVSEQDMNDLYFILHMENYDEMKKTKP